MADSTTGAPAAGLEVVLASCPICGSGELRLLGSRTDGVRVLQCAPCGMGFVERHPRDLSLLYVDEYFRSDGQSHPDRGYSDHDAVSVHSTRWAASLIGLMLPSGAVLDVGCANGDLLSHLGPGLRRFGVEVNPAMGARCRASGIKIIAADICDPGLTKRYRGRFAVVSAIAVLEHLADMAGALRQIRALLKPGGILLFEVPLISESIDSTMWFRSSLEHVYYPTVKALRSLFQTTFGHPMVGSEVAIQNYGPTFVGLVGADVVAQAEAERLHARLFLAPVSSLADPAEITFRFLFDVVHAARRGPEELALLARADGAAFTPEIRARLAELWQVDAQLQGWVKALEEARDYERTQATNWQREAQNLLRLNEELRRYQTDLEEALDFSRAQAEGREREAPGPSKRG